MLCPPGLRPCEEPAAFLLFMSRPCRNGAHSLYFFFFFWCFAPLHLDTTEKPPWRVTDTAFLSHRVPHVRRSYMFAQVQLVAKCNEQPEFIQILNLVARKS